MLVLWRCRSREKKVLSALLGCSGDKALGPDGFSMAFWVKGRSVKRAQISHLLFVDDTLVFCQASQDHLTYLSWLLMWFEVVSGLRISLEKSELIPVGRVENIDDLDLELFVEWVVSRPFYLGLPLGVLFKSVTVWDGVEERFRKRAFNDWEVNEMERFLDRLHEKRVHGDVDDMVFWTETNSGKFFVKSLYLALKGVMGAAFIS
ncbi:hypothetical protein CK203_080715 [Vitis vinifera]|uniref:Reverse transcriptase domain-containing protein n=1 Tax=Vitis vinifera TaxID=29760 RepID=A0A438DZ83_VITVI|nr:hypothetical protein CK203_080715 [Vitis vinifera]